MAGPLLFDRVKETASTTGTGDFLLEGAAAGGFRMFSQVLSSGDTCYYCIQNTSAAEWEVGIGTFQTGSTLQRTTVLSSSNSGSLVNFSSGTKQVFITDPSALLLINGLVTEASPDAAVDFVAIYDVSSGGVKKALLNAVGTSLPVADTQTIVKGSADATKLLRFEVDGFTTGTTRVLTPPDANATIAGLEVVQTFTVTQTFAASPLAPFGSGSNTIRLGPGAGRDLATGADNICIGSAAGDALTDGTRNICIGTDAGTSLTTGDENIAIGYHALDSATIENRNIAIGSTALDALTTGHQNIAIGFQALLSMTLSSDNIAIGTNAMLNAGNSGTCIGIGRYALASLGSSGDNNIGIGENAGYTITTGDFNVVISGSGTFGFGTLTTGSNNILIGQDADTTAAATTDAIGLGQDAAVASNEVSFGPNQTSIHVHVLSSTSTNRKRFSLTAANIDNTDATRKYRLIVSVWDTAEREAIRCDADGAGANISLFGAGSFGSGTNVVFVTNAATAPTVNPTGGGILYSTGGAGTWRGSGGTTTTFGPAGKHCGVCGYDFWDVMAENDNWKAKLLKCGWCGKVYRKGPASVLHLLTEQQKRELIFD